MKRTLTLTHRFWSLSVTQNSSLCPWLASGVVKSQERAHHNGLACDRRADIRWEWPTGRSDDLRGRIQRPRSQYLFQTCLTCVSVVGWKAGMYIVTTMGLCSRDPDPPNLHVSRIFSRKKKSVLQPGSTHRSGSSSTVTWIRLISCIASTKQPLERPASTAKLVMRCGIPTVKNTKTHWTQQQIQDGIGVLLTHSMSPNLFEIVLQCSARMGNTFTLSRKNGSSPLPLHPHQLSDVRWCACAHVFAVLSKRSTWPDKAICENDTFWTRWLSEIVLTQGLNCQNTHTHTTRTSCDTNPSSPLPPGPTVDVCSNPSPDPHVECIAHAHPFTVTLFSGFESPLDPKEHGFPHNLVKHYLPSLFLHWRYFSLLWTWSIGPTKNTLSPPPKKKIEPLRLEHGGVHEEWLPLTTRVCAMVCSRLFPWVWAVNFSTSKSPQNALFLLSGLSSSSTFHRV